MSINIIVNTKFSAIHFWPDCNIEEVDYLRYPHRHEFHVKVKAPVTHDNRDIEFIYLKNSLERWLSTNWDKRNLKQKSCEMMCKELMFHFPKLNYVQILEDNENGAELIKESNLEKPLRKFTDNFEDEDNLRNCTEIG